MESDLSLEFLRVTEQAAIACAHTMGQVIATAPIKWPSKRCAAKWTPCRSTGRSSSARASATKRRCYIGEKVGLAQKDRTSHRKWDEVDIAVDPLEGTNLCATGAANAIAVLAASEKGGLLHAPDLYMEKLVVGPTSKHLVDLDAPGTQNLRAIARSLARQVDELTIVVLDRPRHEKLIADIRATGARIRLIGDGDLSAGISAAVSGTGVHALMGTGGAGRRAHRRRHALLERRNLRAPQSRQA
jgi:fructose-1,6-bisphosphatase/sedoheptulose 1,7-bisphosphatase-like protein